MKRFETFVTEIHRRKVWQIGGGYVPAAWLVLKIVFKVYEKFHFSEASLPYIAMFLVIGWPIVIILFWIFEISPNRVGRWEKRDIGTAIPEKPITTPHGEPAAVPELVDIDHLPDTPYKRLVGRDKELVSSERAWEDPDTNILSLVAEGGAGKSALVNEWLVRLQQDNYRGAEAVLGWSFYSQGTKERATSAELFLNWAIEKLGPTVTSTSASAKGEAIAEALAARRILLVLDGVEPMQHGPGPQQGDLKDQGLRILLRRVAALPPGASHGLLVLTSRLAVTDIDKWKDAAAPVVNLENLSDEAGAELLKGNGVKGTDKELRNAVADFGGHALALSLLASYLRDLHHGDVRQRDRIGPLMTDEDDPRHGHAKRVMESYEKEWLSEHPVLHAIMYLIGLFDRPASGGCLDALCAPPVIEGLTKDLVGLKSRKWKRAVSRLREARLLAPEDPKDPEGLDAHPLIREWFGDRLKEQNAAAWRTAHGRLYHHLRDTTKEGDSPSLDDLAPLYQAIAHGCRAGRYQETLQDIYVSRICRRLPSGKIEFYTFQKLGAVGSDLAAISWFFAKPYETPVAKLRDADQSWVLGDAASGLRAQGRVAESLPANRAATKMAEAAKDFKNAAIRASNLSEAELYIGDIIAAIASAVRSVGFADKSDDDFHMMSKRTTHADALQAAGRRGEAEALFAEAERRQKEQQPNYPILYSHQGYHYCELLISKGDWTAARDRTGQTLEWARNHGFLLDIALDTLTLGRAHLGLALDNLAAKAGSSAAHDDARTAHARLNEAVEGLRESGQSDDVPRGLLARAALRRGVGDWAAAGRDLDEVEEIAGPGPMRLYLCDGALERARVCLARIEAFAPLNGVLDGGPPRPEAPDAAAAGTLKAEALALLDEARGIIAECGYHKRDDELDELDAVLEGDRRFADLPPRV